MIESEISFEDDFKELTSPKNFSKFIGLIVPIVAVILSNKDKFLSTFIIILGVTFLLIILYFFIRWFFVYRKTKKKDEKSEKEERIESHLKEIKNLLKNAETREEKRDLENMMKEILKPTKLWRPTFKI